MIILETSPIMEQPGAFLPILLVGFIGTIIFLFISIALTKTCITEIPGIICAVISITFLIICVYGAINTIIEPTVDTGRIKQTVRLDNTVSMNDFYNKYTILEHTKYTDVYTVEEIRK